MRLFLGRNYKGDYDLSHFMAATIRVIYRWGNLLAATIRVVIDEDFYWPLL